MNLVLIWISSDVLCAAQAHPSGSDSCQSCSSSGSNEAPWLPEHFFPSHGALPMLMSTPWAAERPGTAHTVLQGSRSRTAKTRLGGCWYSPGRAELTAPGELPLAMHICASRCTHLHVGTVLV